METDAVDGGWGVSVVALTEEVPHTKHTDTHTYARTHAKQKLGGLKDRPAAAVQ